VDFLDHLKICKYVKLGIAYIGLIVKKMQWFYVKVKWMNFYTLSLAVLF